MKTLADWIRRYPRWAGILGSALISWGSCNSEFSHGPEGWPNPVVRAIGAAVPTPVDWLLIVAGAALLSAAWWALRPSSDSGTRVATLPDALLTLAIWSAPLLLAPPILSADAVLYADLGWILHVGQNPYLVGLTGAGGPFAPQVDPLWAGNGVAYPPGSLLAAEVVVAATGAHPYWTVAAMRLPAIVGILLIGLALPGLARRLGVPGERALWLGLLNPMVVLHFAGGAHNDALMVGLALWAVRVALLRPHWVFGLVFGPVLVGVAMLAKQQSGLAVLATAGLPIIAQLRGVGLPVRLWRLGWRSAVAAAVAVTVFVAGSIASGLGFGWLGWLDLMGNTGTPAPFSIIGKLGALILGAAGGDASGFLTVIGVLSNLALVATLTWVVLHFSDRPLHAVAWGSLAVSVLGQSLHPWYTPWSFALLALIPLSRRQQSWVERFAIAFVVWNAIQTVVWHSMP